MTEHTLRTDEEIEAMSEPLPEPKAAEWYAEQCASYGYQLGPDQVNALLKQLSDLRAERTQILSQLSEAILGVQDPTLTLEQLVSAARKQRETLHGETRAKLEARADNAALLDLAISGGCGCKSNPPEKRCSQEASRQAILSQPHPGAPLLEEMERLRGELAEKEVARKEALARLSEVCDDWDKLKHELTVARNDLIREGMERDAALALVARLRDALAHLNSGSQDEIDSSEYWKPALDALDLTPEQAGEELRLLHAVAEAAYGLLHSWGHSRCRCEQTKPKECQACRLNKALAALDAHREAVRNV